MIEEPCSRNRFGELLRAFRMAQSLSQREVAQRAGLATSAVSALERGARRNPYPHTVRSLVEALGLDEQDRVALVEAVPRHLGQRTTGGWGELGSVVEPAAAREDTTVTRVGRPASLWELPGPVVGRDIELASLDATLRNPTRRLITLTGPGGVGKTTLALAAAALAQDAFPDGVIRVALADVIEPAAVLPAIATAFGLVDVAPDDVIALAGLLAGRRLLLVLDNLEHVRTTGTNLATLISLCPGLVILATSRVSLRVRAEQEVHVEPLTHDDAVRLFREQAAARGSEPATDSATAAIVDALCERADGLPLALELAASASALLGPATLLDRLDGLPLPPLQDLPVRQRNMTATLSWSHDLLDRPAQMLLARLSVLRGSFCLAQSAAVLDGNPAAQPDDVIPVLADLVDHSLVQRLADAGTVSRFRLLEPVRQFAAGRLGDVERHDALRRLADFELGTFHVLTEDLRGPSQLVAMDIVDADFANIRQAFDHLLTLNRADDAEYLLWTLRVPLGARGRARETLAANQRARSYDLGDLARARSLVVDALLALLTGDAIAISGPAAEALVLAQRCGDARLTAEAAVLVASGATFTRSADAETSLDRARDLVGRTGDLWCEYFLRLTEGHAALLDRRTDDAEHALHAAERCARALHIDFELSTVHLLQAALAAERADHQGSADRLADLVEHCVSHRYPTLLAWALPALAAATAALGEAAAAARLFAAGESYARRRDVERGFPLARATAQRGLDATHAALGSAFDVEWERGRRATPHEVVGLARAVATPARSGRDPHLASG